ncbi:Cytochrome b5 reductase 4 [Oryzias melastigma]|uniref:Cytochrome b5 reductase 4 n=1 Tax=Oryzias melastigma TaxID=30732 RepID=A0A834BZ38_ORYME|nr:Cytochrome b5 reductase 4 [Oryzias melastigma]
MASSNQRVFNRSTNGASILIGSVKGSGCLRCVGTMLNVPAQSFPAPGSQQRVGPSEPSGSGRNKVVLKPGHSLMDWIRFAKSGKDLTGLRGRLIEVSPEELKKHNSRDDCWTCIRGMVYNVTPYMDYHPGGGDELMKAAGLDGTDLFDQLSEWLVSDHLGGEPAGCGGPRLVRHASSTDGPCSTRFRSSSTNQRFSASIPSSGCMTADLREDLLRVEILLGKMSYMLNLSEQYSYSSSIHTAFSVGKIQLTMRKLTKGKWGTLGQPLEHHNTFLWKKDRAIFYRDCVLVSKMEVNHNTQLFRLQFPQGTIMHVPVGKHIYLKACIKDNEVVRPYTPVDQRLAAGPHSPSQEPDLYLMIKVYPDGVFTQHLNSLQTGDHISVSGPEGSFSLRLLRDVTHLFLLAAGTGFTPMARLIRFSLQEIDTVRKTKLLFFNRRKEDILWHNELDELAADDERFQVEYVLSEPQGLCSNSRKGGVDDDVLREFLVRPHGSRCLVCVCGPTAFTELTVRLLKQLGFSEEELHAFQG